MGLCGIELFRICYRRPLTGVTRPASRVNVHEQVERTWAAEWRPPVVIAALTPLPVTYIDGFQYPQSATVNTVALDSIVIYMGTRNCRFDCS